MSQHPTVSFKINGENVQICVKIQHDLLACDIKGVHYTVSLWKGQSTKSNASTDQNDTHSRDLCSWMIHDSWLGIVLTALLRELGKK